MADKTKSQLTALNNANFPNNNSGFITPQKLRDFNQDMIDSMVTDIDSILTGSITVDGTITATHFVGDGSGITGVVSSVPLGTVSGSSQVILQDTTGDLSGSRINGPVSEAVNSVSSSYSTTANFAIRSELADEVQFSGVTDKPTLVSGSSQIDYPLISNIPSGIISSSEQLPSGLVSGSSQVSYPELSNIPSGIVSSSSQVVLEDTTGDLTGSRIEGAVSLSTTSSYALSAEADNVTFDDTQFAYTASNVQIALQRLSANKADISQLTSNVTTFPTDTASDVGGYFALVTSSVDVRYNDPSVDIPTGDITTTGQLVASLITDSYLFLGNPGLVNLSTNGQIRKVAGSGDANFYYEVYTRSGSVETLIATSDNTAPVDSSVYAEFSAAAVLNNGTFTENDRIVLKFYGNRIAGGSDPSYQFQFGGDTPVRTLFPVPASVLVSPWDGEFTGDATITGTLNVTDAFTSSLQEGNIWVGDSSNKNIQTSTSSFAKNNIDNTFTGNQTFNDITVNGTGSFAHINYVTGSATIIGDAFVVLNTDTPTLRYAGLKVIDSGSGGSASLEWDGDTDRWLIVDEQDNSAYLLSGPTGSIGGETLLTDNKLPKSAVGNQLVDSNISDNGTAITLGVGTTITTGNLEFGGTNQVIFNPNGIVESGEVATNNLLTDTIEVNTSTFIAVTSDILSSGAITASFFVGDGSQLTGVVKPSETGSFATLSSNTFVGNQIISGNIEMSEGTVLISRVLDVVDEMATPLMLVDTIEPNTATDIGITANNLIVSGNIQMAPNTAIVGGLFESTGEMATPLFLVDNIEPNNGTAVQFDSSILISGSVSTEVQPLTITSLQTTIDFSETSLFELTLGEGVDTEILASNVGKGQTINVLITQNGTTAGTVSFSSAFLQPDGSTYTPTTTLGGQDILTLMTYNDISKIYVVATNTFV